MEIGVDEEAVATLLDSKKWQESRDIALMDAMPTKAGYTKIAARGLGCREKSGVKFGAWKIHLSKRRPKKTANASHNLTPNKQQ